MDELQHPCQFVVHCKARKWQNISSQDWYEYAEQSANGLANCILSHLTCLGHFATQSVNTDIDNPDIQKFTTNLQKIDLPSVFAIVDGQAVFVGIRYRKDGLTDVQKEAISALILVGVSVYVACDFQGFYEWFSALIKGFSEADALPFGPPPIW
jgi:hypothetical protein